MVHVLIMAVYLQALVENAVLYNKTKNAHLKSISCGEVSYDYSSIAKAKDQVVDTMVTGLNQKFKKSKIAIVNGYGEIIDKHTVQVTSDNGEIAEYNADYVVMATDQSLQCHLLSKIITPM